MTARFALSVGLRNLFVDPNGKILSYTDKSTWKLFSFEPIALGTLEANLDGPLALGLMERIADLLAKAPEGSRYQFLIQRRKKPGFAERQAVGVGFETRFYLLECLDARGDTFAARALSETGISIQECPASQLLDIEAALFGQSQNQNVLPDVLWEENHLRIGARFAKVLSLTELPAATWAGCFSSLLDAQHEYILSLKLSVPKPSKIRRALEAKRRVSHALSVHSSLEMRNIESNANLSATEEQLERISIGKEALHTLSLGVVLIGESLSVLEDRCAELSREITSGCNAGIFTENLGAMAVFTSHLPGADTCSFRELPILTRNLAHLLPIIFDRNAAQEQSSLELVSRNGECSKLNFFSAQNLNFNAFVCGASGSGKSFFVNSAIASFRADAPQGAAFIFDVGGSYAKLTQAEGGEVVNFTPETATSLIKSALRPMTFSPTGFCKTFLRVLCGEGAHFTHSHMVAIEDLLQECEGAPFRIKTLIMEAVERRKAVFDDIALWLAPFERFDLEDTFRRSFNLDRHITAFDFKELESDALLQRLTILVLTDAIWSRLKDRRYPKTLIVFDEVWKFFKESQSFIEEMYRTLRKYGAGIVSITQSLADYGDAAFAKLVITNSYTRIILQGGANAQLLQQALDLSPSDIERCLGVSSHKGRYSEFFVHTPTFTQIYRLYPTQTLFERANTEHALAIPKEVNS